MTIKEVEKVVVENGMEMGFFKMDRESDGWNFT